MPEPAALRALALEHVFCSCGGKLVRTDDPAGDVLALVALGSLFFGAIADSPALMRIGMLAADAYVAHRASSPARDFERDTKTLAAGHAKLDRDDPKLN